MKSNGFFSKLISIEPDEPITDEEIKREKENLQREEEQSTKERENNVRQIPVGKYEPKFPTVSMSRSMKINVVSPSSLEDCKALLDKIRDGESVIVDFSKKEIDLARSMFDFMCGGIYMANAKIQKITPYIFLFTNGRDEIVIGK